MQFITHLDATAAQYLHMEVVFEMKSRVIWGNCEKSIIDFLGHKRQWTLTGANKLF